MEKEELSFLMQMLTSMKETFSKLKENYEDNNFEGFASSKKSLIKIGEEIDSKLNGK
jgi:DNA-binding protein YbaB